MNELGKPEEATGEQDEVNYIPVSLSMPFSKRLNVRKTHLEQALNRGTDCTI